MGGNKTVELGVGVHSLTKEEKYAKRQKRQQKFIEKNRNWIFGSKYGGKSRTREKK